MAFKLLTDLFPPVRLNVALGGPGDGLIVPAVAAIRGAPTVWLSVNRPVVEVFVSDSQHVRLDAYINSIDGNAHYIIEVRES